MAGTLEFDARAVRELVAISIYATAYRIAMEELFDPQMHINGVIKASDKGMPTLESINPAKLEPKLWLVKGHGVYLTSNAATNNDRPFKSYAKGLSPDDPRTEWIGSRIMGGGDCLIPIPVSAFQKVLSESVAAMRILVSAEQFHIFS